ncbi:MAG: adhesin, partial [Proteobacteria bacterium]|nr:adhesin [Pseudomonadota bacterium]
GRTAAATTEAAGAGGRTAAATTEAAGAGGRTAVVRARGTIGEAVFEDTNQMARASEMARADEATLIAERVALREVKKKGALPNGNMATAHAEVGVIQQAFKAGKTMGADMKLVVEGKPVCGHCLGDIPAMAEKAGLKSLTVVEEATGKTLQWKPGMRTLKAAE